MATFTRYEPKSEKELHSIIEKELDALEEGLVLLKYELGLEKGIPDFLCVDSGGGLVIIEVKLKEDENILFQALRYYNEIDRDRYAIAKLFSDNKIDPKQDPLIILIAERFSDDIRRLSTLVIPDVELYEYTVLRGQKSEEEGICYHWVSLPPPPSSLEPGPSIRELRNRMTNESLKPVFDKLIEEIKSIDKGIEEYAAQKYVGFKYRGRGIAYIEPQRKSFYIFANVLDENRKVLSTEHTRVLSETQDYQDMLEIIRKSYENLVS
jgi:predicted transport protein